LPDSIEGSLTVERREFDLGIYTPTPPSSQDLEAAQAEAHGRLPGVTVLPSKRTVDAPTALIFAPSIQALPPPTPDFIRTDGRGIRTGQADLIAGSQGLIAMAFRFDDDASLARLHAVQVLALDVARNGIGAIWDESTREIYGADEWARVRVEGWEGNRPDVRRHIAIRYDDSPLGGRRLLSLGMQKFGLPDLVVNGVAARDVGNATRIIDGLAQLLVEGATLEPGGVMHLNFGAIKHAGARKTYMEAAGAGAMFAWTLTLTPMPRVQGDPDNRLVAVRFPSLPAPPDAGGTETPQAPAPAAADAGARR
jgi:hypothetical protein